MCFHLKLLVPETNFKELRGSLSSLLSVFLLWSKDLQWSFLHDCVTENDKLQASHEVRHFLSHRDVLKNDKQKANWFV